MAFTTDPAYKLNVAAPKAPEPAKTVQPQIQSPSQPQAPAAVSVATSSGPLDQDVVRMAKAIRQVESGGNFNAQGKSGESGGYQFMPETWKAWAGKYLGNPNADLSPRNQNEVAYKHIKELKDSGLNPGQIASEWNSGRTDSHYNGVKGVNQFGAAYDVPKYVSNVYAEYEKLKGEEAQNVPPTQPSAVTQVPTSEEITSAATSARPSGIVQGAKDLYEGVKKGAFSTILKGGALGTRVLSGITGIAPVGGIPETAAIEEFTEPVGTMQKVGKMGEQLGEFLLPGLKAEKGAGLAARLAVGTGDILAKTALQTGANPEAMRTAAVAGPLGGLAGEGLAFAGQKISPMLAKSASKEYGQALNATTKATKAMSEKVKPRLLAERVSGTLQGIKTLAEKKADEAATALELGYEALPQGAKMKVRPIVEAITKAKESMYVVKDGKRIILNEQGYKNLTEMGRKLVKFGTDVEVGTIREARQILDQAVKEANGFFGKTLAEGSEVAAKKKAADAIRREFEKNFPDIDKLNKEFSFWQNVDDVVGETLKRREGQAIPLSQSIAQGAGAAGAIATGGGLGKIWLVGQGLKLVKKATTSTMWRTLSAVNKMRLADVLAREGVNAFLTQLGKPLSLAVPGLIPHTQENDTK
jgi:muramidase (phage lysozyme)